MEGEKQNGQGINLCPRVRLTGFSLCQLQNNCRYEFLDLQIQNFADTIFFNHFYQAFEVPLIKNNGWNLISFVPLGGNTYMFDLLRLLTSAFWKLRKGTNLMAIFFKWLQQIPKLPDYWELWTWLHICLFKVKLCPGYLRIGWGKGQQWRLACRYLVKSPTGDDGEFFTQTDHNFQEDLHSQKAIQSRTTTSNRKVQFCLTVELVVHNLEIQQSGRWSSLRRWIGWQGSS